VEFSRDSNPFSVRAILDSNQWPLAPENYAGHFQGTERRGNALRSFGIPGTSAGANAGRFQHAERVPARNVDCPHGPGRLRVVRGGLECLLRVREVAARLSVSTATVRSLVRRGELSAVRVSNAIRVRPEDLEAYVRRGRG
jgi:excisionase family DNA binding protein